MVRHTRPYERCVAACVIVCVTVCVTVCVVVHFRVLHRFCPLSRTAIVRHTDPFERFVAAFVQRVLLCVLQCVAVCCRDSSLSRIALVCGTSAYERVLVACVLAVCCNVLQSVAETLLSPASLCCITLVYLKGVCMHTWCTHICTRIYNHTNSWMYLSHEKQVMSHIYISHILCDVRHIYIILCDMTCCHIYIYITLTKSWVMRSHESWVMSHESWVMRSKSCRISHILQSVVPQSSMIYIITDISHTNSWTHSSRGKQ